MSRFDLHPYVDSYHVAITALIGSELDARRTLTSTLRSGYYDPENGSYWIRQILATQRAQDELLTRVGH